MSQISPPIRILLAGSIALLAAWFLFLRPGAPTASVAPVATATAPAATDTTTGNATSAPGKAVDAATGTAAAAATADAASAGATAAATPSATATAQATTTPAATATPSAADAAAAAQLKAAHLPAPVTKALAADRVLVLYFWDPKAADDRAVRAEVKKVDRHHGKVAVQVAKVSNIGRYVAITKGVDVQQSPSIVVIDRNREGTLLTGYVDAVTIDQAVTDALSVKKPKS